MTQMLAYRVHKFGGPEVLQPKEIEVPALGDHEVLVRVQTESVNPVDFKARSGE